MSNNEQEVTESYKENCNFWKFTPEARGKIEEDTVCECRKDSDNGKRACDIWSGEMS